jgi:hypothetical protein
LQKQLTEHGIPIKKELNGDIKPGSVVFLAGHAEDSHRDYVTQSWTTDPLADILNRLPEYQQ